MIDGAWAAAAALPVLLLIASFLMAYQNIPGEAPGNDGGVTQIFRRIFTATYLFSFTWWELVALAPLLGALAIAAVLILLPLASDELSALAGFGGGVAGVILGLVLARLPER